MASNAPRRNNPALPRNASTTLDPPSTSRSSGSISTNPIRRNLFPQAARRQLRHDSASSSASTVRDSNSSENQHSNDIIIRDPLNGGFTIDAPHLPAPREVTQEDEEREARERMIEAWGRMRGMGSVDVSGFEDQQGESNTFSSSTRTRPMESMEQNGGGDTVVFDDDVENLNVRLRVANETRSNADIKSVLMTSLEEKLANLDEDGWMFGDKEKEEDL